MSAAFPWDLIATYLAVRQTGSLSGAARALRLSQPTVRRQIELLEAHLGTPLFTRSANGLIPAPGTDDLVAEAQGMAAAAASFARRAVGAADAPRGRVRLSVSEIFATEILPPILARMRQALPGIAIDLSVTNRPEDILRREADIALRLAPPRQAALVARRLPPVTLGLYAAPGALARSVEGMDYPQFQREGPFIGDDTATTLDQGFAALGLPPPAHVVFRSDNHPAQLAALRAGIGVGLCQDRIAATHGLVRILPALTFALPLFVVMHEDLRNLAPVRAVFDHLVAALMPATPAGPPG